jgi:serine/threonine protein phosphatase PrpC
MLNGNIKLKLKKRNTNTPNIMHKKNTQLFVDPKQIINNNRPHSKYILKNKGSNNKINKNNFPIKISNKPNNAAIKINMNNINNIHAININNKKKNININGQPKIIPFQGPKKFGINYFSEDSNRKVKRFFLGSGNNNRHTEKEEEKKNNIIIIDQLSKSLKKNNNGQNNNINQIYNFKEQNKKNNNKIFVKNNIKRINIKNNENDLNKLLPILNKDNTKNNSPFLEENHFKPDSNMPNQIHLLNNKKEFGKKQNMNVIKPMNSKKNQIFINKNFKINKKRIILHSPEINQINNIFNINIHANIENNPYIAQNKLLENNNNNLKNRKNKIIKNRENNFLAKEKNKDDNNKINKYIIKKSIEHLLIRNNNNNLLAKNNIIGTRVSSSEEPIIIGHSKLKLKSGKKNNNENSEKKVKILDYYCEENKNEKNNEAMEDFTLIKHPFFSQGDNNLSLFAVFDGHGGTQIAEYLKNNFSEHLLNSINKDYTLRFREILKKSIETMDKNMEKLEFSQNCGSTGTFIIVNNNSIYCANIGDSKCFYINDKEAIQLTEDHNCKNEKEVEFLRSKGAVIFMQRIYGSLSLTRSFGDMEFKQYGVNAVPYITKINADKNNVKYIVIASDGIWDVVNDKDLFKISKGLKNGSSEEFCNTLVKYAMEKGSNDNISCIIIRFGLD